MPAYSILFPPGFDDRGVQPAGEDTLADLHVDQIIADITHGYESDEMERILRMPLGCVDAIEYRQEVFRDLEQPVILNAVRSFAAAFDRVHRYLQTAGRMRSEVHAGGWFVRAVHTYCRAIRSLARDLDPAAPDAQALRELTRHLRDYVQSEAFRTLFSAARTLRVDLSEVIYTLHIRGQHVEVSEFAGEPDYGAEVRRAFERLQGGTAGNGIFDRPRSWGVSWLERQIADGINRFFPDTARRLRAFYREHADFLSAHLTSLHREVHFYLAYLDYTEELREAGLHFCYPEMTAQDKRVRARAGFDLALARRLAHRGENVVPNDFHLGRGERVLLVTGANQGGKTTFARTFGQLHYLANLGCPVPARQARLRVFDRILTHFEREEDIENLRGRMEDDLLRIREVLDRATPDSIVILNETFTSATLKDEMFLSRKIVRRILDRDALGVCVSFVYELASLSDRIVSMVAGVDPEDPSVRTFKVERRPPDGLAHALSIARKHRLTRDQLGERIP